MMRFDASCSQPFFAVLADFWVQPRGSIARIAQPHRAWPPCLQFLLRSCCNFAAFSGISRAVTASEGVRAQVSGQKRASLVPPINLFAPDLSNRHLITGNVWVLNIAHASKFVQQEAGVCTCVLYKLFAFQEFVLCSTRRKFPFLRLF